MENLNKNKKKEFFNLRNLKNLGIGTAATLATMTSNAQKSEKVYVDQNDTKKIEELTKKGIEIKKDTVYYGSESVNDPELKNLASSKEEIIKEYLSGKVKQYEVHTLNSKFRKLREGYFKNNIEKVYIEYKGKPVSVAIFTKGQHEALKEYYRKIGFGEGKTITKTTDTSNVVHYELNFEDINETAYEEVVTLKRPYFINGALWGQNPDKNMWGYINDGMPVVILHIEIDGRKTTWLTGLAPCSPNYVKEAMPASCVFIKEHNKSLQNK